jgi:ferredoxin
LLDDLVRHWKREGDPALLRIERFQPDIGEANVGGRGGSITFGTRGVRVDCERETSILLAGEEAGVLLPSGCRQGICHTCVGQLASGQVRDLRTGEVHGDPGERVRTCVNAPEGDVEIAFD